MRSIYEKWTFKKIIVGKLLYVLILTYLFSTFMSNLSDSLLTQFMNRNNDGFYTYNYSLGPFNTIYTILGVYLSLVVIKGYLFLHFKFLDSSLAAKLNLPKLVNKEQVESSKWYTSFIIPFRILKKLSKWALYLFIGYIIVMITIVVVFVNWISPKDNYPSRPERVLVRYRDNLYELRRR